MEFLETHVRALYRLLGHRKDEYTDVRCIDVNKRGSPPLSRLLLQGESALVEWAKKYNGKGNCFVGRNPRDKEGTVCRISAFSLDLDPERPTGSAASPELVEKAFVGARAVEQTFRGGYIAASGNGALILYKPAEDPKDFRAFEQALQKFQSKAQTLCPQGVKVDATQDSARLIKVIGTLSTKGSREHWRASKFVRLPSPPYAVSRALDDFIEPLPGIQTDEATVLPVRGYVSPTARLQDAEDALKRLGTHRAEVYDSWVKVGMSLKEFGDVGLQLWREWSKKSEKYQEGDCEAKWATFTRSILDTSPKLSIGSILKWADEDSGGHTASVQLDMGDVFSPNGNLAEHRRRLLERGQRAAPELPTGLPNLDRHTWGFVRGELFTIAARTGIGKTSIASCIARNVLQAQKRVLFFSTEMSASLIVNRIISSKQGISGDCFKTGRFTHTELNLLDAGYGWLGQAGERLAICDSASPGIEKVRLLAARHKPDVLIFDHIQRVGGRSDSARVNISEFIRGLKDVARTNNCAVLVLSQLRRMFRDLKSGQMPPPQMSDLKESGTIEEESGQVLLLHVLSERSDDPLCHLVGNLEKNRFGPNCKVGIEFNRSTAEFREMGTHE